MSEDRWRGYLDTTVAVVIDGETVDLTGPDAVEAWPFDGPVHVLTAWDPSGRVMTREDNEKANAALRDDLVSVGARVWDSSGHDGPVSGDTFIDAGFVVVGPTESDVIALALRYDQEAIYTMTDQDLILVASRSQRRETRPRRGRRRST